MTFAVGNSSALAILVAKAVGRQRRLPFTSAEKLLG